MHSPSYASGTFHVAQVVTKVVAMPIRLLHKGPLAGSAGVPPAAVMPSKRNTMGPARCRRSRDLRRTCRMGLIGPERIWLQLPIG